MISMDMKYTALYWALRFVEAELDVHRKSYGEYEIAIYAEEQNADLGNRIGFNGRYPLTTHKSFVALELIDRLLTEGYAPEQISVNRDLDVVIDGRTVVECFAWGDYRHEPKAEAVRYTSRLVSGLLEYKGCYLKDGRTVGFGFGVQTKENVAADSDFEIVGDELIRYNGTEKTVRVPEGIVSIGASAFWNNTSVREVILPNTLERIGGDCFYYCTNLERVTVPEKVSIMGNNPFAGCPKLKLENKSPYFLLENGVLYDRSKRNLIHYTILNKETEFTVPDTVICLGKHCFFACDNLERIVIPESVIRMENNPFSGCTKLSVENHSPFYHFESGVIYNKFKTTVIGCLNGTQIDRLTLPDTVTLISRNAFWNCKGIKNLVISKNVDRIGYNPFAGSENILLESRSPAVHCENGVLYSVDKTELLCTTNRAIGKRFKVPDTVTRINRGVFSGCKDLESIDLNNVTYIDKSSFTSCTSLTELYIPDGVTYIGEWVFAYCSNLKKISISRKTVIDQNAFNECPAEIEWRE